MNIKKYQTALSRANTSTTPRCSRHSVVTAVVTTTHFTAIIQVNLR